MTATEGEKTCSKCLLAKPLEAFYTAPRGRLGRASHCKECRRAEGRQRYATPEGKRKRDASTVAWMRRNRDFWNACQSKWARERKARQMKELS